MIGHPVVRAWYERHGLPTEGPARPNADDPDIHRFVAHLAEGRRTIDLGGADSLNLLVKDPDVVLRVNRPYVSRAHILGGQHLHMKLQRQGIGVATPVRHDAMSAFRCGRSWANLEEYVPNLRPFTGQAIFAAIGTLHRALATVTSAPPRPLVTTCVSPQTLHRWLTLNRAAQHPALSVPGKAEELAILIRKLARRWVSPDRLPVQLIHQDAHPDNIRMTTTGNPFYLDLGGAARGPRIHDIAYALASLLFESHDTTNSTDLAEFPWKQLPIMLADYEHGAGIVLTEDERQALPAYAAAVAIYYDVCGYGRRPVSHIGAWLLEHRAAIITAM